MHDQQPRPEDLGDRTRDFARLGSVRLAPRSVGGPVDQLAHDQVLTDVNVSRTFPPSAGVSCCAHACTGTPPGRAPSASPYAARRPRVGAARRAGSCVARHRGSVGWRERAEQRRSPSRSPRADARPWLKSPVPRLAGAPLPSPSGAGCRTLAGSTPACRCSAGWRGSRDGTQRPRVTVAVPVALRIDRRRARHTQLGQLPSDARDTTTG